MQKEILAKAKNVKGSATKARLVANQIRGKDVNKAIQILSFSRKSSSLKILKVLKSAIANAENNFGMDISDLYISTIYVDGATMLKRIMPRAKGKADRILKRTSHIVVKVSSLSNK